MLCRIYKEEGYFVRIDEDEKCLIGCDNGIDEQDVDNIISVCVKYGLFDKDMYEQYGILTSREIQKIYVKAVEKRKEIFIESKYWLLEGDVDVTESILNRIVFIGVSSPLNPSSAVVSSHINPQSKVNKSKVNQSTVEQSKVQESTVNKSTVNESIEKESKQEESIVEEIKVEQSTVEESKETSLSIPSFTSSLINSYTNNSTLSSLLTSYMEYRVKNNLDMSEKYINNLVHLLDKLADNDEQKIIIVDTALKKNWKSFFPIDFERLEREQQQANNRDYIKGNENFDDQYLFDL